MSDWDDLGYEPEYAGGPDEYDVSARESLRAFFEANDSGVFFVNQLVVQNEATFFHWVTRNAIDYLIADGLLATEKRKLAGSDIKLLWHKRHRYYKRDAGKIMNLVNEYGSPNMCAAIGLWGEQMVLAGSRSASFCSETSTHAATVRRNGPRRTRTLTLSLSATDGATVSK